MRASAPGAGWSGRDKAARSARLSTIRYSSMEWILPPRTPIVSTTGTPQAAILLPSHTPPDGCQPIAWPRSAPACLTRWNSASASARHRLGRPAETAVHLDVDVMLLRRLVERLGDQPRRNFLVVAVARPHVDPQHGKVGDDIVGRSAVDLRRIDLQARDLRIAKPQREFGGGDRRCGHPPGCARRGPSGRDDEAEIAAAGPRAGKRSVGQAAGS